MEIIIARHGKTVFTEKSVFEGCSSSNPLTKEGVKYAKELAKFLKEYGITAIFSSPLVRAKETAEHISKATGVPVKTEPLLKEICYGSWEGKAKSELKGTEQWNEKYASGNKYDYVHPGKNSEGQPGESHRDAEKRIQPFFRKLMKERGKIVVICHAGIIRTARRILEGISEDEVSDFWLSTDEIYVMKDGKAEVVKFR